MPVGHVDNHCGPCRETLLGQLTVHLRQIRDDFLQMSTHGKAVPKGKNLPETVNNILWVKQLEAKVDTATGAM